MGRREARQAVVASIPHPHAAPPGEPAPSRHAVRVVAGVIRHGALFLVCRRPTHKRHGGLWEFPGGKCNPGESDEDALRRELHEELGVTVTAVGTELFAIDDPGSHFRIAFVPVEIGGRPLCLEHSELTWATPQALLSLELAPGDRSFVQHLLDRGA